MPQSATHTEILKRMHVWIWLRLCFIFPNRSENCGRIFLFFLFPLHPQVTFMFQTIIAVKWPHLSIALKGELKFSGCHLKHEAETTVKSWCSSRCQILLLLFPVLWQPKVTISYKCGKQMTFQFFLGHPPALLLPSLSLSVQKDDFHSACNVDRNSVLLSPKEIHSRSKNKAWF